MPEVNQPKSPADAAPQTAPASPSASPLSCRRLILGRLAIVVFGVAVGQFILYGQSLLGLKVLLPLDILAEPGIYLPVHPGEKIAPPHNNILSDMIFIGEPTRMVNVEEFWAGRWPSWTTHQFAGALTMAPRYSPFWVLYMLVKSPIILAWEQMLVAQVAGIGFYIFARRVLGTAFWPAAIMAWAYPLTGFFIYWQGYGLSFAVCWLPWLLFAADWVVHGRSLWRGPALAVITALTVVSGNADVSGQTLLTCGLFAVWRMVEAYVRIRWAVGGWWWAARGGWRRWFGNEWNVVSKARTLRSVLTLTAAWGLGLMLSTPYLLPIVEYTRDGARFARRSQGEEERKPIGLAALPQVIFPTYYGSTEDGQPWYPPPNQGNVLESSATTYAGLLTTLLLAPLAFASRRHRGLSVFWILLAVVALGWQLNIPGVVNVLRMGPLKMFSHNRFVFAATFAICALAAVGLDLLWQQALSWRIWSVIPAGLVGVVAIGMLIRGAVVGPILEHFYTGQYFSRLVASNPQVDRMELMRAAQQEAQRMVAQYGASLFITYFAAIALCAAVIAGWLAVWLLPPRHHRKLLAGIAVLLLFDLLTFGYGRSAQCDWSMYYPRIPVLQQMARAGDWRMIGFGCLPPALSATHGLKDVRGYDAVDPAEYVELLFRAAQDPNSFKISYAATQFLVPKITPTGSGGIRLHPILDMLGVRYVVFRGDPPKNLIPAFSGDSYWAMENPNALPRVFVPRHVAVIADPAARLDELGKETFDPRETAYVEVPTAISGDCRGTAQITSQTPVRIAVAAHMETPGLLVLADRWDPGWMAEVDGKAAPILRTNHAVRGIELPAGEKKIVFRYNPASARWGARLAVLAMVCLAGWCVLGRFGKPLPELPGEPADEEPAVQPSPPKMTPATTTSPMKKKGRKGR